MSQNNHYLDFYTVLTQMYTLVGIQQSYLCGSALEFLQPSLQALHVADELGVLLAEEILVQVDLWEKATRLTTRLMKWQNYNMLHM